ncbi:unnamed protein product [Rhodiola kirilowii]
MLIRFKVMMIGFIIFESNRTEPIVFVDRVILKIEIQLNASLLSLVRFSRPIFATRSQLNFVSSPYSQIYRFPCGVNMPRYYCDYCDTYLTHDSPSVRKQHNAGYKHKANVRTYYQQFEQELSQTMLDQKIKQHLVQAGPYQPIGAAYNQHLAGMPGRPPLMPFPRPGMPLGPNQMMPMPMRPPMLPVPVPGGQSYPGAPPNMPQMGQLPGPPPLPPQMNGIPQPHLANPPTTAPGSSEPPTSGAPPSFAPPGMYHPSNPVAPASGGYANFNANN